jgi:hypothetical protein
MQMHPLPQPGQSLHMTNPDYLILSEEWQVLTVEYPTITFSCQKWWDYNSITMQGKTSEIVIGTIVQVTAKEIIVAFSQYSGIQVEVGLAISGQKATYLRQIAPPAHA